MKELNLTEIVNQIRINSNEYSKKVPNPILVKDFFNHTLRILFPSINNSIIPQKSDLELLNRELMELLSHSLLDSSNSEVIAGKFIQDLPFLQLNLIKDAQAICQGDPAAQSVLEVILSYPGFIAIAAHRIAHEFYKEKCRLQQFAPYNDGQFIFYLHSLSYPNSEAVGAFSTEGWQTQGPATG